MPEASAATSITTPFVWDSNATYNLEYGGTPNVVTVSGSGSITMANNAARTLNIANPTTGNDGTLILQNGGSISNAVTGNGSRALTVNIANGTNAQGTLIIGGQLGSPQVAGQFEGGSSGLITISSTGTGASGLLLFNYTDGVFYLTKGAVPTGAGIRIRGATRIQQNSTGTTYIANTSDAHDYTGTTIVNNGILVMVGAKSGAGSTTIAAGATLRVGNGGTTGSWVGPIATSAGGSLIFSRSTNYEIPTSVKMTGDGDITFNAAGSGYLRTVTGATINGADNIYITGSGPVTLNGPLTDIGNLFINSSASTTIASLLNSTAYIEKQGSGTATITAGTTSGNISINAGTLAFGGNAAWATSPTSIYVGANATLRFNRSAATTITSAITGPGSLVKLGSALTLTGTNLYTGGTTITGSLILSGGGTLGTGAIILRPDSILNLNGDGVILPNTIDRFQTSGTAASITKTGSGTVTLTGDIGAKKYLSGLSVTGGSLVLGNGGTPPNWGIHAGNINIATGASLVFNHDGFLYPYVRTGVASVDAGHRWRTAFQGGGDLINRGEGITALMAYNNTTDTLSGRLIAERGTFQIGMGRDRGQLTAAIFDIRTNGTIAVWRKRDLHDDSTNTRRVVNRIIGDGTFIKKGTNFVHLTNADTDFSGTYIVEGGGLRFGRNATNEHGITNSTADFVLQRTSVKDATKTSVLVIGNTGNAMHFSGDISGVGALRKLSTSMLVLTGDNSYSGGTHIAGGIGSGNLSTNLYTTNAGTIQVGDFDAAYGGGYTGSLGTGTVLFSTYSTAANNYGNILINRNGTLEIPGNIVGGNNWTTPGTYNTITHSGGNDPANPATTILSGNNSFRGSIIVERGTVILSGNNTDSVGNNSNYIVKPGTGATLQIGDGGVGGRIYQTATTGSTSAADNTRLDFRGATIEINHADTVTWSRPLKGSVTTNSPTNVQYYLYNQSNTASKFIQTGTGTTILSGTNTAYEGTIQIDNGRLQISDDTNLGASSTNIINGGTLVLAGNTTKNWTLAVGERENGIEVPSAVTAIFEGTLSEEGGFTKLGAGTLKLINEYDLGNIVVREGVLDLTTLSGNLGIYLVNSSLEGGTLKLGNTSGTTNLDSGWKIAVPATGKNTIDITSGTSVDGWVGISGAGDFTVTGGGTLVLGNSIVDPQYGPNPDFSGAVTIDGGQLQLTVPGALGGTVGTPTGAVHQLIDGTLTLSSATPTTYFDNWHVPGRTTLQQPIINVRENDVITLSGRLTSDANAPLKFTGNPAMSANPSTLILTNPRTALRGDIEVDRNFILVFEPPAGAVQTVGTDSSLKNITGLGSIVKRGDGALYINANIGTSTEAALDFRQGTLGGTGRIEHISYISDGDSSEPTVTFDPGSAPNKVGTLSISLADVPFQYDQFFRNVIFHVDIGDDGNGGTVNDKMDFSFSGGKGVSMKGMTVDIATVGGRYDDDGAGRAIITKIPLNTGITNPDIYTFKGVRFSGSATDPISNLRASRSFDPAPTNGSPPVPISILLHTSSVNASLLNWNNSNGATWEAGEIEWEDGLSHTAKAFKHGDQVMFMNGSPSVNRAVDVSTDGVIVGSMGIEGGSYTFTGGAIVGGIFHDYQGGWSDGKLTISGNATATINNRIDFEEIRIEFSNSKLILGNTGQLAYGQKIDLVEAGILEFAKNTDYTFTGIVKGSGTISQAGSGTLTLTGGLHSADYTEENNFVFDGKLLIAAGTTITFDLDANKTQKIIGVEGTVLLGEGTLNKIGAGTLTLEGAADFMGTINVKAGVLSLKDNAAGWSTNTLGNATLELEGNHTGSWQLNGMRSTISVAGANEVRFSGDITSLPDTQLVKAGTGNLILAGNNTYSGDTRVEEGTLTLRGTLGNMGTAPDTFNDYEKNIYISAGAQLRLENQTTSNSFSGESNYQRLSGNISGPGNMVINTTPQPGDTRNNTIYDFYGKVDAPMSVVRGTIGGTAFLSNVSFTSTISQPDPNLPPVASVVISPGNNWIQYEADGTTFTQETAPIGKLTIGQSNPTGYLNLTNVELLIDIDDGNKSDTLLISGNALWGAGNIVNIRTNPNSKESWDEATYIIARTNPANGQTTANYQKFMGTSQANLKTTEIRLNGLPVENTRLEASLTFMDELKSSKSMGEGASSGSLSSNGFGAIYQSDTSAIILKTKGGVSQVLYWQGKDAVTEAQSHKWTAAHKDGALNWKWNRTPDDSDRVISFWDGDAVFLSAKDGPLNKNPATALLDVTNRTVVIEALEPEHAGDPKTVYVASMFIDGGLSDNNPYRISGDKITGSMVSSTGSAIETTNSNEEFLWLTGKLTITPKGKATFENDVSFFEIIVQGKETLVDPYDVPIATPQTGGEVTFEGKTHILSEVLSIGQAATATLAGQGEFQNVGRITIGTGGKFIFNKNVDYAFDGSISNRPRLDTTAGDTYGSVLSYDTGGSVEKYGSGKVTLSGTNSYKGDTTVAAGTLAVTGVLGAYESIVDPGDYRYVPRYTNKITIGDAATLSFSPSHAVTEPAYDEEGNLIPQPAVPGMELPEQILAGDIVGPASGQGILRKEGEGILTLEKAVPATVRFEHTAGVLAGGYVGSALAIPDITFSQGAIISPGGRPTIYHESGTKHNTNATGGVGTGFSDALKYGRMTFGTGTNTTEFNGIQYNIDIDATNVANRDYIKVLGNARVGVDEFGTEVPNKVYLGAVSGFTDKTYVVMGVTGDLTTGDLTRTEFIYTNSGTDPRNRIALVRPLEGATTYGEDNLPWNKVLLLRSFLDANIGMTWTGVNFTDKTDNSTWSTSGTIKNWREGADANRYFKQADVVDFPDNVDIDVVVGETTSTVTFTVTQRDVQIVQPVIVGGMTVSGTGYTFSGDSISGTDNSADGSDPSKTTPNIFAPNKLSIIAGGEAEFRNSSVTFKEMEVVSGKALFLTPYTGTASGILNITGTAPIAVSGELVLGWGPNRSPFHTDSNKDITLSGNGSVDFRVAAGTPSTYSGLVNGTGGGGGSDPYAFVKSGPGSLIVSADQTYSGSTQVAEGSLTFQGTLGAVTSSGGTDRATYNGSMHVADAASLTLQVGTATRNVIQTLSSNVTAGAAGTGALIKTGPGRLNVNGTVAATFHAQAGIIGGTGTFQNGATISAGVLISAGLNNGTTGSVLTFEMATSTTVMLVPANAGMIVDIHNSSHSNSIFVAGTLTFDGAADSGTHPFTVNPVDVNEWRAGQYLVATATGGINLANGADKLYYDGRALDTYSDIGGRLVIKRNDVSGDTELWLLTYLASRGLVWWGTEVGHGTDTSDTWNSMTENWKYYENGSYPGPPPLSGPEEMTAFADGDHALFLNNQAPKTVVVQNGGVKVFAMTIGSVGNDAAFTFSGDGKITGRDDIWISDNVDPFAGASTPAGGLQIEAMGKAVFNNTGGLDFNGDILVEGEATFNYSVTTPKLRIEFDTGVDNPANAYARATLGNTGSFAGVAEINVEHVKSELVLNRTTNDGIYSGPIYGAGQLFKTGAAEMTLGGAITLTGPITVRGGKLSLTGTLGTKTGDTADAVTYTHNTGVITIEPTATLTINTPEKATNSNSELVEFIQVIDSIGKPDHPPTPTDRNYGTLRGASNTTLEIGGSSFNGTDPAITGRHSHVDIADSFSPFQGNIVVREGAKLDVTGRIGVFHDTWDKGTVWEATYWHANYAGKIELEANSKIAFSSTADYQQLSGILTGPASSTLEKGGYFPVYFTGDASGFSGSTNIVNGNFFIDTPAASYGAAGAGAFTVNGGAALYAELWRGNLTLNASNFTMATGSGLVVRGNGSLNIVTPVDPNTVSLAARVGVHIAVGALDYDASVRRLTEPEKVISPDPIPSLNPIPAAKVSFRSAAGTVRADADGVALPAGGINLSVAYNPTDVYVLITLLDGINIAALPPNVSVSTSSQDILDYLGLSSSANPTALV